MMNGSLKGLVSAELAIIALLTTLPLAAQSESKPDNCYNYKLDSTTNRIIFNDPRPIVLMPDVEERARLRADGTPGQLFKMKNCDAPDFAGRVDVYSEPDEASASKKVPSATRVIVLDQQGNWHKVKGYTSLWEGTGWVQSGKNDVLVVKFSQ